MLVLAALAVESSDERGELVLVVDFSRWVSASQWTAREPSHAYTHTGGERIRLLQPLTAAGIRLNNIQLDWGNKE